MFEPSWTEQEIQMLKDGRAAGLSFGMLAMKIMGKSRSAIISKAKRLRLVGGRGTESIVPSLRGGRPRCVAVTDRTPEAVVVPITEPEPSGKPIWQLGANECRYTKSDDAPFLFCGAETEPGVSWCRYHCGRVFNPGAYRLNP